MTERLDGIRIVLVQTYHPGNIGAAARAMKNMGVTELVLVQPRCFPDPEATARAGSASDLLDNARVVNTLAEAIADCGWVVGTSARARAFQLPQGTPAQWADQIVTERLQHPVALVFGRERMGLHNDEIVQCQGHMMIPSHPDHPVLNIAQAIQVICYELYQAHQAGATVEPASTVAYPTQAQLEHFYVRLEHRLVQRGFLANHSHQQTLQRLLGVFKRARPNAKELNTWQGALSALTESDTAD